MFPRVAWIGDDGLIRYGKKGKKVAVHPSSCNSRLRDPNTYLLYQEVFKSSFGKVYLKETTTVGRLALLLFSQSCQIESSDSGSLQLDAGISVRGVTARQVAIVRAFRQHLQTLFEDPQSPALFRSEGLKVFTQMLKERSK